MSRDRFVSLLLSTINIGVAFAMFILWIDTRVPVLLFGTGFTLGLGIALFALGIGRRVG